MGGARRPRGAGRRGDRRRVLPAAGRRRSPFTHRHREAEEVYVVLRGRGRVKLDDEILDVGPLDAIRVAPGTARAFEAGDDGLDLLAFGPHRGNDGVPVDDPWTA